MRHVDNGIQILLDAHADDVLTKILNTNRYLSDYAAALLNKMEEDNSDCDMQSERRDEKDEQEFT